MPSSTHNCHSNDGVCCSFNLKGSNNTRTFPHSSWQVYLKEASEKGEKLLALCCRLMFLHSMLNYYKIWESLICSHVWIFDFQNHNYSGELTQFRKLEFQGKGVNLSQVHFSLLQKTVAHWWDSRTCIFSFNEAFGKYRLQGNCYY